ncbi:MAG: ImmA/IrrE family metallo-endopeptidase [Alphaproteobacteria bacterium]
MNLPATPVAWAIKISTLLQAVQTGTGEPMYPVNVQEIAQHISKHFFPNAPITKISGEAFNGNFEGALIQVPGTKNSWGIAYNTAIKSSGRINFTLAHEFGHYLLHRESLKNGIECSRRDMMRWDGEHNKREAEANEFASYLLMPRNLFEIEMQKGDLSLHLLQHVADYFDVSLTAAILKWLSFTTERAMLVVGKDGFVDWVWHSENLIKSGVYMQPKREPIELPLQSLAANKDIEFDNVTGVTHSAGVWPFKEDVQEMTVHADTYDMTITLLVFPKHASRQWSEDEEEPEPYDSYDNFVSFDKKMSGK